MTLRIKSGTSSLLNVSGSLANAAACCCSTACAVESDDFYLFICPDVATWCASDPYVDTAINIGSVTSGVPKAVNLSNTSCTSQVFHYCDIETCAANLNLTNVKVFVTITYTGVNYSASFNLAADFGWTDCTATARLGGGAQSITNRTLISSTSNAGCTFGTLSSGVCTQKIVGNGIIDGSCTPSANFYGFKPTDNGGSTGNMAWWIAKLGDIPAC